MSNIIDVIQDFPREYVIGLSMVAFATYYLIEVVKHPNVVCREGPFKVFLYDNIPLIKEKFWPSLLCFESRLQTVIASILRSSFLPDIKYKREILALSDGGEVALDWMEEGCHHDSPVVVILPGLTGASQAEYIKCLVHGALSVGVRTVIFNNRGLGGLKLKTPRLYCAANYEDLAEVVKHIRAKHSTTLLGATGISMGGLILGNYLAAKKENCNIDYSMIISVPWNVFKGCESIEKPYLNSMLGRHLAESLRNIFNGCEPFMETKGNWDFEGIKQCRTVREFDAAFTSKHFGYKDVDEYYDAATLHNKLHDITIPVLCLSAADDPFQPLEAIPVEEASKSGNVAIVITARGGHIGFLEGIWPGKATDQYMARLFSQYFGAIFKHGSALRHSLETC